MFVFTQYALRQRYCCNPTKKEKHEHVKGMFISMKDDLF